MNANRTGLFICSLVLLGHCPLLRAGSHGHASASVSNAARPAAQVAHGNFRGWSPAHSSRSFRTVASHHSFRTGPAVRWNANSNRNAPRWARNRNGNGNRYAHWRGRRCGNRIIVIGSYGYPWYLPYPYYDDYSPYGAYPAAYTYETTPSSTSTVYEGTPADDPAQGSYDDSAAGDSQGSNILEVQRRLAREGFYQGPLDGAFGSRTYYAIRAYQRRHHLRVDGQVSPQLLEALDLR